MIYELGEDKRYYGFYRGTVVDPIDPEGLGRIKLQVPQVLGSAVTTWAWPMGGEITQKAIPYGAFQSTEDQASTNIALPSVMTFNTTDFASGVHLNGNNDIIIERAGVYNIQWSGQFENDGSPTDTYDVTVWLRQNDVDIVGSSGLVAIHAKHGSTPGHSIIGWNYFLKFAAGDKLQFIWQPTNIGVTLQAYPGVVPSVPSTASVIATLNLIGNAIPNPGDGCWVTFEGGDPNFPLWLGAF